MNSNVSELLVYYQNVRGLRTKTNTFFNNVLSSNYMIVALTETNLQNSINSSEIFPDYYNVFRCDRNLEVTGRQGGGGVLLAVYNDLLCSRIESFSDTIPGCECVCVKISNNKGNALFICVVYFRPRSPLGIYQTFFDLFIQLKLSVNSRILILGDFNLSVYGKDYYLNDGDILCKELSIFLNINNLILKNDVRNFQNKTLDLIITNEEEEVTVTRCEDKLVGEDPYHPTLEVSVVTVVPLSYRSRSTRPAGYCYRRANFFQIYQQLSRVDWSYLYSLSNIDQSVDYFYNQIYNILDQCCPLRKEKQSKYPFWFTPSIIFNLKRKEKLRRRWKKTSSEQNYLLFKAQRTLVKNEINLAHCNYINNLENNINFDSSKFWNFIKNKKTGKNKMIVMEYNGIKYDSGVTVANAFADYFSSVYERYVSEPSVESAVEGPCRAGVSCLTLPHLRCRDVQDAIKKLKSKSTTGPDLLPQYLFKGCSELLIKPLTFLFNLSLTSKMFPEKWKITKVTPIFKAGKRDQIINYRPVAVLSVPAKIFEMIVHKYLFGHFEKYISDCQHGFVPGRSVNTNLLNFTTYVSSGLDSGTRTDTLFLDLAKAFDKVDHSILLEKLHSYGVSNNLLYFFKSYIFNRKQFVSYYGVSSSTFSVQSGVPQGSNLGPCLFTILINDLTNCISSAKALLFADDLKLFKHINCPNDSLRLQQDLDNVYEWSRINKMTFNVSKCYLMIFTRLQDNQNCDYFLNGVLINRVNKIKDLGIYMTHTLSFNPHVEACIASASKLMGFIIRQSINFRKTETLITLYFSLVRSRLESGAVIWNPFHITYREALERVQKRFLRFLFYKCFNVYTYTIPYHELLMMFGFRGLALRRTLMGLVFLCRLARGGVGDAASLARLSIRVPSFQSRNKLLFSLPHCRTASHASSPLFQLMRSYNILISVNNDIDLFFDSPNVFKSKCLAGLMMLNA